MSEISNFVVLKIFILKKAVVIVFVLSFAARPLVFVGYFSYFQLNIDSIIEKYCVNKDVPQLSCNGKCHLAKQLQTTRTNDDGSPAITTLADSFFPVFFESSEIIDFSSTCIIQKRVTSSWHNDYHFDFTSQHLRPPIV